MTEPPLVDGLDRGQISEYRGKNAFYADINRFSQELNVNVVSGYKCLILQCYLDFCEFCLSKPIKYDS